MKIIISFLALTLSASAMAMSFENVIGEYEVTYKTGIIFSKEENFKISYLETKQGNYGDLEFESEELGFCTNQNNLGGRADYGYAITNSDETLTKLDTSNEVTFVHSTLFCDSGWYQLAIETTRGELEKTQIGETIKAGFKLRNSESRTVLDKKATIQRLN